MSEPIWNKFLTERDKGIPVIYTTGVDRKSVV